MLDQSPIPSGSTPGDALRNSIDLAAHADELGYTRYWLAEHHNSTSLAGSSPEILIGQVAAATRRIRVGSGGVMLSHYSPLKVVENFRVLHALFPHRIDLGIGRAPGSDQLTARALRPDHGSAGEDDFPRQLGELIGFLEGRFAPGHPFAAIDPSPQAPGGPELWLLGSSGFSAAYAAHLAVPFCHAHFISPADSEQVTAQYRASFDRRDGGEPRVALAVSVICGEDDDDAERLALSSRVWRRRRAAGRPGPVPSVAEALAEPPEDPRTSRNLLRPPGRLILGGPYEVRTQIEELAEAHGADEVVIVTIVHDHQARRRSYELIAKAFELSAPSEPSEHLR
ncbi:MAG: Luciferase-like monooxygenase YhbW [uncultured Acidimicrobiales bacterium]|uniref:Luciferase-like monooxygenase YhbW n=1 Tax=uncultured Acidimicrobiales bacterium TaxID=310071 RepID=A0A6J4ISM6_9ACTN|nr:MAG: Luciferase-like monooxygenase YhbW [uncultured Acidimicrobiales bacterium]